tara:strand:- start:13 stop:522 length:510 start_codon:yes stop_codon:yes gene_type:complete
MAFKMKGSPMQRNFGIGNSGFKQDDDATEKWKQKISHTTDSIMSADHPDLMEHLKNKENLSVTDMAKLRDFGNQAIKKAKNIVGPKPEEKDSPLENYKKGYYGEGSSSMKQTDDKKSFTKTVKDDLHDKPKEKSFTKTIKEKTYRKGDWTNPNHPHHKQMVDIMTKKKK